MINNKKKEKVIYDYLSQYRFGVFGSSLNENIKFPKDLDIFLTCKTDKIPVLINTLSPFQEILSISIDNYGTGAGGGKKNRRENKQRKKILDMTIFSRNDKFQSFLAYDNKKFKENVSFSEFSFLLNKVS